MGRKDKKQAQKEEAKPAAEKNAGQIKGGKEQPAKEGMLISHAVAFGVVPLIVMSSSLKRPTPAAQASKEPQQSRPKLCDGSSVRVAARLSMTTLPRAVMELVLSFAVKNVSEAKVLPTKRRGWRRLARPDKTPLAAIAEWRLVCHYWRDLLGEILTQYQQRTVKLNLSHKSEEQQEAMLKQVTSAGHKVIELRVALFGHTTRRVGTERTQVVDWKALLSACPNLQRLDVSKMAYLTRRDLGKVLDAASQYCLKLKALVLPLPMRWSKRAPKIVGAYRNDIDDVTLVKHLSAALERWFVRGYCGGLRQLVIPHIPALSNQFLTAVTRFCPNVEILDGWKLTYVSDGWGAVLCDEEWRVSLETWEKFCSGCSDLREFNWAVVPFADAFFVPFGATQKFRLTDLAFDFTDAFLRRKRLSGRAVLATTNSLLSRAEQLIRARSLQAAVPVESASEAEIATLGDTSRPYTSAGLCSLVQGLPFLRSFKVFLHPRHRIDLDVFDDDFLQQLPKSTPYLGQFSFSEAGKYAGPQALECVSDQGLLSLACMAHLSDISIAALSSTSGAGLFPLIKNMSSIIQQRNIKIGIMRDFDKLIEPLLDLVAREPADTFADKAFALMLVNVGHLREFNVTTVEAQDWEDRLQAFQRQLQSSHPTLRFQLTLEQDKPRPGTTAAEGGDKFHILKFSVFTTNWKFQVVAEGTFFRGDISTSTPFEWIVKFSLKSFHHQRSETSAVQAPGLRLSPRDVAPSRSPNYHVTINAFTALNHIFKPVTFTQYRGINPLGAVHPSFFGKQQIIQQIIQSMQPCLVSYWSIKKKNCDSKFVSFCDIAMDALPLALQREICSFAAAPELVPLDASGSDVCSSAPNFASQLTEPSTRNLQRLALVCRAWRDIVAEFREQHETTCVSTLRFATGREEEQEQEIISQLSIGQAGAKLLDLRIVITAEKRALWWDLDAQGQTPTPAQAEAAASELSQWVEWRNILKLCPNLRRLDLTGVPLHHLAMGDLLDAASTYCKKLEALILPKKDNLHADAVADNMDFVFWRLYSALEKWNEASGGKGLRQLTVPSRSEFDREGTSNEFLSTVQKLCPRLEYLDGWKRSYNEGTRLVASDESLCVTRDVWKTFCKSCVALREFSWVVVPFSDEFFLPFGQTTKPQLTRLQLTYNTRAPFRIRRNEYSTGGLNVLVAGCPALEHLDVVLHRLQPCDALIYPQIDEMIDPDVFNDDFFLGLTESCPQLRTLRIRELGSLSNSRKGCITSVNTITDRGLAALCRAPNLTCIDIQDIRCSADAILNFLSTDTAGDQAPVVRSIRFRELGVCFGEVVQHLLNDLAKSSNQEMTEKVTTKPLAISLSSRRGYVFERSWLVELQRAFQSKFSKGELRFAVFNVKKEKDTAVRASSSRSVEQEVIAKILARAWIKGDVLRVGRLVLYTQESALDKRLQKVLANHRGSWILLHKPVQVQSVVHRHRISETNVFTLITLLKSLQSSLSLAPAKPRAFCNLETCPTPTFELADTTRSRWRRRANMSIDIVYDGHNFDWSSTQLPH
ncbi:unnamed protein product [Phytophthora lilii]|uniref:Unnamed protein product n=1 Tax=Phytophthora lilii TaxID=2077276 RepID=A0A9W6WLQ1_9STRA|nr:unnamed protein product [Phytophthora lilii]